MPEPAAVSHSPTPPPPLAIVVSRYNASITDRLLEGALAEYRARGGAPTAVDVFPAPGSYELPAIALAAAASRRYGAVVALGCLIKGETSHDRYIAEAVAHGLVEVTMRTGVPVALGVLTVDTPEQAAARAGGSQGNKGREAVAAALETAGVIESARRGTRLDCGMRIAECGMAAKPDKSGGGPR
jgi:6,7-dimethyl-8-ribityllumazine synthase